MADEPEDEEQEEPEDSDTEVDDEKNYYDERNEAFNDVMSAADEVGLTNEEIQRIALFIWIMEDDFLTLFSLMDPTKPTARRKHTKLPQYALDRKEMEDMRQLQRLAAKQAEPQDDPPSPDAENAPDPKAEG